MTYDFKLLSQYRTELMGVATIWVLLFHSSLNLFLLNFFRSVGYGGVDIFLFVSGIGIYFSLLKKDFSTIDFYKRRFKRIIPYTIPIVLLVSTVKYMSNMIGIAHFFSDLIFLSYWLINDLTFWYISVILLFYLISPVYIFIFNQNELISTIIAVFLGIILSVIISNIYPSYLVMFTTRIPIYFIGIYCGYLILKKVTLNTRQLFLCGIILIIGIALLVIFTMQCTVEELVFYGLFWYPFILITLPLCIFISLFFKSIRLDENNIFYFFGSYSLVIYVLSGTVFTFADNIIDTFDISFFSNLIRLIAIFIIIIISYIWQNLVDRFVNSKPILKS